VGPSGGNWSAPANWEVGAPPGDGGVGVFKLNGFALGDQQVKLDAPVTLSGLTFAGPNVYTLAASTGGSLSLTGDAIVDVEGPTVEHPYSYPSRGQSIPGFAGESGLVKTGAGTLTISGPSTYRGTTRITGGVLAVAADTYLGNPANDLIIDGGALRTSGGFVFNRAIYLGPGGGLFEHSASTGTLAGAISGPGAFTFQTVQKNGSDEQWDLNLAGDNTYSGDTNVISIVLNLVQNGTIRGTSRIIDEGGLVFDNGTVPRNDRVGAVPVILRGGNLRLVGHASVPVKQVAGPLVLDTNSRNAITVDGVADTTLRVASIERRGRATLILRGTATSNRLEVAQDTTTALVGGRGAPGTPSIGVIPWISSDRGNQGYMRLATYDASTGVRELMPGEYLTALPAGVTTANVILTGSTVVTAPATVNALELTEHNPVWLDLTGSSPITITSGALAVGSYSTHLSVPIEFGAAEGVISAAGLNVNAPIGGSNGVTWASGAITMAAANTYTGKTTVSCAINLGSDVVAGQAGPFGADNSPVLLAGGYATPTLIRFRSQSSLRFARDLDVLSGVKSSASLIADSEYFGSTAVDVSGTIQLSGTLIVDGRINLTGRITGPGGLRLIGFHRLAGVGNDYAGGTLLDLAPGLTSNASVSVAADEALGTGRALAICPLSIAAEGGPRTLSNPFEFTQASLTANGAYPLTLAGPVRLNGTELTVAAGAGVTISGPLTGGALRLTSGSLVLAGANDYPGTTTVQAGTLRVTNAAALGTSDQSTVTQGTAVLEIDGGVRGSLEPLMLSNKLRSVSGINSWSGPVTFTGGSADITVDAGSLDLMGGATATTAVSKSGAGLLRVTNVRTKSLTVLGGTLAILPGGDVDGTSRATSLTVSTGAKLDVADHVLVIDYASASPVQTIRGYVSGGRLVGNGAVGFAEASKLLGLSGSQTATYEGVLVDATSLIIRPCIAGDANLDGRADFADLALLAQSYNGATGTTWLQGDFNYDGRTDFLDLAILAQHYNTSAPAPATGVPDGPFADDVTRAFAQVPEPGTAGMACIWLFLACICRHRPAR
jgi:autotransporter-associated beta strand protein